MSLTLEQTEEVCAKTNATVTTPRTTRFVSIVIDVIDVYAANVRAQSLPADSALRV
ncbi:MAG: hypothetical protein ACKV19_25585 [Verrucomicrobiales bacterium]